MVSFIPDTPLSLTVTCRQCGNVFSPTDYRRDLVHAQCRGCQRAFEILIRVVDPGQAVRLVEPSRWVPVSPR